MAAVSPAPHADSGLQGGAIGGIVAGTVGALVTLVTLLLGIACLRRRREFREQQRLSDASEHSERRQTAERNRTRTTLHLQLIDGRPRFVSNHDLANSSSQQSSSEARGRRSDRPFQYNQRQDSGASIRSVPIYQDEAAEDEVVLMRPRPSSEDLTRVATSQTDDQQSGSQSLDHDRNMSSASIPLMQPPEPALPPDYVVRTPDRNSLALTPNSTIGFDDASIAETGESNHLQASTSSSGSHQPQHHRSYSAEPNTLPTSMRPMLLTRLGHRHTASVDEASMGSVGGTSFADHRLRERLRASTTGRGPAVKGNRLRSQTASAVRPSLNVLPSMSMSRPGSSFQPGHRSTQSAGTSNSSLVISEPIRDTLVRSQDQFVYPRRGLSPAQLSFLSSRESLALVGMQTERTPPSFDIAEGRTSTEQLPEASGESEEAAFEELRRRPRSESLTLPELPPGAVRGGGGGGASGPPTPNTPQAPTPAIVVDGGSRPSTPNFLSERSLTDRMPVSASSSRIRSHSTGRWS